MSLALVVLAAGLSTRYGALKQLEPVGPRGQALMDYSIYDAASAGFTKIVFVIRRETEQVFRTHVQDHVGQSRAVSLAFQDPAESPVGGEGHGSRTRPWGTAHAVLAARGEVTTAFAVCNADDLYGASAYRAIASHLRTPERADRPCHALVGYRLQDTLSAAGGVSRAVCDCDRTGRVVGITELTDVKKHNSLITGNTPTGHERRLTGDEIVSMNLWGFTPEVFAPLERQFQRFLRRRGKPRDPEFLISTALNAQVRSGQAHVQVLQTSEQWYGITFRGDKQRAASAIRRLIGAGHYPADLDAWFRTHL